MVLLPRGPHMACVLVMELSLFFWSADVNCVKVLLVHYLVNLLNVFSCLVNRLNFVERNDTIPLAGSIQSLCLKILSSMQLQPAQLVTFQDLLHRHGLIICDLIIRLIKNICHLVFLPNMNQKYNSASFLPEYINRL